MAKATIKKAPHTFPAVTLELEGIEAELLFILACKVSGDGPYASAAVTIFNAFTKELPYYKSVENIKKIQGRTWNNFMQSISVQGEATNSSSDELTNAF